MAKTPTAAALAKSDKAEEIEAAAGLVAQEIMSRGWASQKELAEWSGQLAPPMGVMVLHQALARCKREGITTEKMGPEPERELGFEVILGASRGAETKRYGPLGPSIPLNMVLQTPCLGQISLDGVKFSLPRDAEGKVIFVPGQCRAMLGKAFLQSGLTHEIISAAFDRLNIKFLGVEWNDKPIEAIRRPVNTKKGAVGELRHEALPPGSVIKWVVRFPSSHFTEDQIQQLLETARTVGFSPSGCGKGGNHGVFSLRPNEAVVQESTAQVTPDRSEEEQPVHHTPETEPPAQHM